MKIPYNLILRPDLQERLNIRLREAQKPLLWFLIWVIPLFNILLWIGNIKGKLFLDPDTMTRDIICGGISVLIVMVAAIGLKRPKWITIGDLVARSFVTLLLCYLQHKMLSGKDTNNMVYFKLVYTYRRIIFLSFL